MYCREKFCKKHKEARTEMKMFLKGGAMLTGPVNDYDEDTILIGECLANWDNILSITPK